MQRLEFKERIANGQTILYTIAIVICTLLLLTKMSALFGEFGTYVIVMSLIYTIGGLSVNLITGYCGQLSLGQAGFFAIGAYSAGIFSKFLITSGVPHTATIIISIIFAAVVSGIFGLIIGLPTLRLSGDYLAIVTLGFAEIIRIVIKNAEWLTGGGIGLDKIPKFSTLRGQSTFYSFMWVLVVFIIIVFFTFMLINSSKGRRIVSVREDEIAANAMGINVKINKQIAFVLAAVIAGIGGALFAFVQGSINPLSFDFQMSVDFLIIAVFGGLGSFSGTIIAGMVLTIINQGILPSIKDINPMFADIQTWRLPIYAVILILVMVYRPGGLLGHKELSITKFWNKVFKINKEDVNNTESKEGAINV